MTPTKFEFKLWDTKNKRFISGFKDANKLSLGCGNDIQYPEELAISFAHGPDEYLKICRCTGLKDMNGQEIYEGDIITKDETLMSVVEYESGAFFANGHGTFQLSCASNDYKIVGNVYQNPDMIKRSWLDERD